MIRAIFYGLSVYIALMLIVSGISFIFSPKPEAPPNQHATVLRETKDEEEPDDPADSTSHNHTAKSSPTVSPFAFHVNVITNTPETESSIPHFIFSPILTTEPPNILGTLLAELEMRKQFIVRIPLRRYRKDNLYQRKRGDK